MIGNAFRSDWVKLRRTTLVLGVFGGLSAAASFVVVLLGIVAFGVAAFQFALEYSLGTLRQLLVRQPRRRIVLTGKYLGANYLVGTAFLPASTCSRRDITA